MCYSNSSTSKNIDLAKKYGKKIPKEMDETLVFFSSGFSYPTWRIVTKDSTLENMNWGLIPSWFKDSDYKEIASMTLNARVETIDEKASFKHLIHRQECIVPSTGFFEWKTIGKEKIPYFIHSVNGPIFSMAGLYDHWLDPVLGTMRKTFTILTCPANELMAEIHNTKKRMPVILESSQENLWLEGNLDPKGFIHPIDSNIILAHEVNKKIILSKENNLLEVQLPFENSFFTQGELF
jgi:putative SOS response-associated peptidase YedK